MIILNLSKDVIIMNRYIALLRGININGKNKISMAELKSVLNENGFIDVQSHLNSGNIIFSTAINSKESLAQKIKSLIAEHFGLDILVFIISQQDLADILAHAPAWWGTADQAIYDNLIFVLSSIAATDIAAKIGAPTADLEQILIHENVIFWSFDRKKYAKANWWKKTAQNGITEMLTIRTANTLRKIVNL